MLQRPERADTIRVFTVSARFTLAIGPDGSRPMSGTLPFRSTPAPVPKRRRGLVKDRRKRPGGTTARLPFAEFRPVSEPARKAERRFDRGPDGLQFDFVDAMCARFGWTREEVEAARRLEDARRGILRLPTERELARRRRRHPPGVLPFLEFAEAA